MPARATSRRRNEKVTTVAKSTARAGLKQYDRVTGTIWQAAALPRKIVGRLVGEKNPKPYKATKEWEFWLKDGEIYRNARGNRGPISDTGMPANVRWESSKAHFDHYFGKGIYNPAKFDRCVRDVKAHASGPVNAYAVCTAAGTRNPQAPTLQELEAAVTLAGYTLSKGASYEDRDIIYACSVESIRGAMGHPSFEAMYNKDTGWLTVGDTHTFAPNPKRGGKRAKGNPPNPEAPARAMYESFHGKPPEGETVIKEEFHEHEWLAPLGLAVSMKVATLTGLNAEIEISPAESEKTDYDETAAGPDAVFLAANEEGTQLYFVGGDQALNLDKLKFTGDWVKDSMVIGVIYEITYRTRKKFDKFELTDYYHELGEETGDQPMLVYDSLSPHCSISGGKYKIKMPLVGVSPGIEN